MQHTSASTKIYYTSEYKRFKLITGNRQLNENKIKKIISDIDNGTDMLRYCPVIVTEKNDRLHIIDGQHRYWVSKHLKCPVWYTITEDISLYDIARLNSNTEKWNSKDYINCYVELGNKNYLILQRILDEHSIPVTTAIGLLQNARVNDGSSAKPNFEKGAFKVNHEEFTIQILEICKKFNYEKNLTRGFIKAIIKIKEKGIADLNDLIIKVNEQPEAIQSTASLKCLSPH